MRVAITGSTGLIGAALCFLGMVVLFLILFLTGEARARRGVVSSLGGASRAKRPNAVAGVAEVASVGGFVKQYQVSINPNTLLAYHLSIDHVIKAIQQSNNEVGGRVVEYTGREYMVRGLGYIHSVADLQKVVVGTNGDGTPIYLRNVADVHLGPDMRRGEADLNGEGQAVGGIVIARYGENALAKDINFTLTRGECLGIIGGNGAGKTNALERPESAVASRSWRPKPPLT